MTPAWAQRQEALLRDCIVSPDVFDHMVERLRDFAVPYQHVLETEASQRNVHLYLAGGVLVKRGQLTRPSFEVSRTCGATCVPGSPPMAEGPCCPQAQSLALGMCPLLPPL